MNALGASVLAPLLLIVLFGPRRWAVVGMVAGVLFLTLGLSVNVGGLNVYALRFLEVAGFVRVMARKEISGVRLNSIDRNLLLLFSYTTVVFMLRSNEEWTFQIGASVDAVLSYLAFRGLI